MSVAGEVTDASIMEVGRSRPQFQYSRVNIVTSVGISQNTMPSFASCAIHITYIFVFFFSGGSNADKKFAII